jgi:hypothetical protein
MKQALQIRRISVERFGAPSACLRRHYASIMIDDWDWGANLPGRSSYGEWPVSAKAVAYAPIGERHELGRKQSS